MNQKIEFLELQNKQLQKQIKFNEDKVRLLRSTCNHKYEKTYEFLDGEYELTCKYCGTKYVR